MSDADRYDPPDVEFEENEEPGDEEPTEGAPAAEPAGELVAPPPLRQRRTFRPHTDPSVVFLDFQTLDRDEHGRVKTRYLGRMRRPFPGDLLAFLGERYGPGAYTVKQFDAQRGYLASRTFHVTDHLGAAAGPGASTTAASPNGAAAPAVPIAPPGADWKAQAVITLGAIVTTGLALIAESLKRSRDPQPDSLDQLLKAAEAFKLTNAERAETFKGAFDLARTVTEATLGAGAGGNGSGDGLNVRELFEGIGALVRSAREGAGAPAPAPPVAAAAPPAALPAPAVGPLGGEAPEQWVERAIVFEVERALNAGDDAETLVTLLEAWLDENALFYLVNTPEEQVLVELPQRFPRSAAYFNRPPVQTFLRSALAMLREDAAEQEREELPGVPDAAACAAH